MKSTKFSLAALPLLMMAAAEAATSTGSAPAPTGAAPATNDAGAAPATKTRAPKNPDNILNIINGRLPLPLVFLIRFKATGTNAERAKAYGTSVGKVFDIVKNKNFGYIDANYKASEEELKAANDWLTTGKTSKGQTLKEAGGDPDGIKKLLDAVPKATAEDVAKRNWQIRTGAVAQNGQAAAAPAAAPAAPGGATSEKPAGAKLF